MTFFRYREDHLPVFIIVSLFFVDLAIFFTVQRLSMVLIWSSFSLFIKLFICAWNHHHQHCPTFHQKFLNRLLEIVYTFHTGITTNVWVLHHNLGHHVNYLDQSKDESRWQRKDGTQMGFIEYTFMTAITGYYRSIMVGKKYPKYLTDLVSMGVVNLILLLVLVWINPINAIIIFIIPMILAYVGTCGTTYFHHAGLETNDPLHASHNVVHDFYNLLTGNLGYHTAHHMKQALHWSKLPEYHRTIEDKIEPSLIEREFPGFGGWVMRRIVRPVRERW